MTSLTFPVFHRSGIKVIFLLHNTSLIILTAASSMGNSFELRTRAWTLIDYFAVSNSKLQYCLVSSSKNIWTARCYFMTFSGIGGYARSLSVCGSGFLTGSIIRAPSGPDHISIPSVLLVAFPLAPGYLGLILQALTSKAIASPSKVTVNTTAFYVTVPMLGFTLVAASN